MQYAWLVWSLILVVIWMIIYLSIYDKQRKKEMLIVSLWTSLLGLTEPLFVPEYWNPPSLFDLAARTGFDIESLIFSFGIGGIAVIIYEQIFRTRHEKIRQRERYFPIHKYHFLVLVSFPLAFIFLLIFTNLNHIYSAIAAMTLGGLFSLYCRPDLKNKMIISAIIFLVIYFVYFLTLITLYPGYTELVWNLGEISGILILGIPLEEYLFALSFGFIWSGIYEHLTWQRIKTT